jgi:GxxExxY protein
MTENEISYLIRGCIFKVYNHYGPGLLESAYLNALLYEIQECGLKVKTEIGVPLVYKGMRLSQGYRLDVLVEEKVIIEIKSVEALLEVHHKQVITYLRLTGLRLTLLINFNVDDIAKGIFRNVNGL